MENQHLLSPGPLLKEDGDLVEAGYAYSLVKEYDRTKIKAGKIRIKEWDYYYVGNHKEGIALTIADNGYMSMISCSTFDYEKKEYLERSAMGLFPMGKLKMPATSETGDVHFKNKKIEMDFIHEGNERHLTCLWREFGKNKEDLRVDIYLTPTTDKTMVIATPFLKKAHFYYNQKINNLRSRGYAKLGEKYLDFGGDSMGVLDWGRGVWTYKNTWYWSSSNDRKDGHNIGWNLGYGFGDTSAASENMFFYDDKAYKLNDVKFEIPVNEKGDNDYGKEWRLTSSDGSILLIFEPLIVRKGGANVLVISSEQNQVFGKFHGTIRVPETGERFSIEEQWGFAEKVSNRW